MLPVFFVESELLIYFCCFACIFFFGCFMFFVVFVCFLCLVFLAVSRSFDFRCSVLVPLITFLIQTEYILLCYIPSVFLSSKFLFKIRIKNALFLIIFIRLWDCHQMHRDKTLLHERWFLYIGKGHLFYIE